MSKKRNVDLVVNGAGLAEIYLLGNLTGSLWKTTFTCRGDDTDLRMVANLVALLEPLNYDLVDPFMMAMPSGLRTSKAITF